MSTTVFITLSPTSGPDLARALDRLGYEVSPAAPPVALLHPKQPAPVNIFDAQKLAKAEAKRARKAQIKRNGGKR